MNPFLILVLFISFVPSAWARVRHVETGTDQIATVKTALGIATIIQVPDRPNSIVVGDQAAFKVEYLEQAITIKPLRAKAKSNLYIFTDYRRFNVQLVTGNAASADYVVYLDNPKVKPEGGVIHWKTVKASLKCDGIRFTVTQIARTHDDILLIEFNLTSKKREKLRPDWFWITQHGVTRPIQNFFLSSLESNPNDKVTGTIQILKSDIDETQPIKVELRKKKTSFLLLPKAASWK